MNSCHQTSALMQLTLECAHGLKWWVCDSWQKFSPGSLPKWVPRLPQEFPCCQSLSLLATEKWGLCNQNLGLMPGKEASLAKKHASYHNFQILSLSEYTERVRSHHSSNVNSSKERASTFNTECNWKTKWKHCNRKDGSWDSYSKGPSHKRWILTLSSIH